MTNSISNARAIASCLPVVGPVVGVYNALTTKFESIGEALQLIALEASLRGVYESEPVDQNEERRLIREMEEGIENLANIKKREIVYSKCAILGNLLTLIGIVSLVAAGIFAGPLVWVFMVGLAVVTIAHTYNLYHANKDSKALAQCQIDRRELALV